MTELVERRNDGTLKVMAMEISNLSKQFENAETLAAEWRLRYDTKMDKVADRLNSLPCKQAEEVAKSQGKEIGWLQKGAVALVGALFAIGVWVGTINSTTNDHEKRLGLIEAIELEAQKIRSTNVAKIAQIEKTMTSGLPPLRT